MEANPIQPELAAPQEPERDEEEEREAQEPPTMIRMLVASYRALPRWKKSLLIVSALFIWPWLLFVATVTAIAHFPVVLLGRWEGALGKSPLVSDVRATIRGRQGLTHHYYAH